MTSFTDLALDPKVLKAVAETGYTTPTPIQAEAIPHALQGRDVLGIAQTGTGKTASFTLPMITMLSKGRARARMPRSLVLAPTRELAAQVAENFKEYAKYSKLSMALLIGGVSFKDQDRLIDRGVDVLIATPGRLLDHFERGKLMLTGVQIMVIDEADRMLDMGFIPDIERIFKLTPFTRQTLFFSATMAPEITRVTQEFLHNPVRVEVARQATTSETIEQAVCMVTPSRKDRGPKEKRDTLRALIKAEGDALTNAIIFCNRKRDVDIVAKSLKKYGLDAAPIHGDLDQSLRTQILTSFRDGELGLLVASDVAARGLDVPSVSHVFNFDVPIHSEDYVHRIGRTGRAGREGKAITLATPAEEKYIAAIEDLVKKPIPRIENPLYANKPAPVEKAESESEKPRRSRTRTRKPKVAEETATPAETAAEPQATPQPAPAPAAQPTPAPAAKKDPQRERQPRGRGGNRRGNGPRVVGMGDHMPLFLTRDLRALQEAANKRDEEKAAEKAAAKAERDARKAAEAAERAANGEEEPAKKPRRRVKKDEVSETAVAVAVETTEVVLAEDTVSAVVEKTPEAGETAAEETAATETAVAETVAEEAPKKPRKKRVSRKKPVAPEETAETAEGEADSEAEEKPKKPRRRRVAKKPAEETPETPAEPPAPETDQGPAQEHPTPEDID